MSLKHFCLEFSDSSQPHIKLELVPIAYSHFPLIFQIWTTPSPLSSCPLHLSNLDYPLLPFKLSPSSFRCGPQLPCQATSHLSNFDYHLSSLKLPPFNPFHFLNLGHLPSKVAHTHCSNLIWTISPSPQVPPFSTSPPP